MPVIIREARLTDLEELIDLIKAHANFEQSSINTIGVKDRIKQAMQGGTHRPCVFVVKLGDAEASVSITNK